MAKQSAFEILYGRASVVAALSSTSQRQKISRCFLLKREREDNNNDFLTPANIETLCKQKNIPITYCERQYLNTLCSNSVHQGIMLEVSHLQPPYISELVLKDPLCSLNRSPLWLLLDEVQDPMNMGSLIRSASFFGIDGICICSKNSSPLSPVVSRASAGALETFSNLFFCNHIPTLLNKSVKSGWRVIATVPPGRHIPSSHSPLEVDTLSRTKPTVLVMGNEGKGIRTNTLRECTHSVSIKGTSSDVASLNVGVCGGILMQRLTIS